jgi:hypothetical protein
MTDLRIIDLDNPNLRDRMWYALHDGVLDQLPSKNLTDIVLAVLRDTSVTAEPDDIWTGLQRLIKEDYYE